MANNEIRITISAENQALIARVREAALSLQQLGGQANQAMNQVSQSAGQTNQAMNQVSQSAGQANQAMNQVSQSAGQTNQAMNQVSQSAGQTNQAMNQVSQSAGQTNQAMNQVSRASANVPAPTSLIDGIGKLGVAAGSVYMALLKIKDIASAIVMPGFNYVKEMETNQLGIAGILTSMTTLNGKALEFGDAMSISSDMMKKMQKDAILTSATTAELVTTFRGLVAPGLGAGMTLDEIQKFTTVGVNAVKAMGLNSTQYLQELRDLVQGGIQASSSTLASSLGLTDADIKKAKASSEGLFKFLMKRLEGFAPMAERFPDTLAGKMSLLEEVSTLASAEITKTFESDIKNALDFLSGLFADINFEAGTIEINPNIIAVIEEIKAGITWLRDYLNDMKGAGYFDWVDDAIITFKSLYNTFKDLFKILMDLHLIWGKFTSSMGGADLRNFLWQGIRAIANEIEWLTKKLREFVELVAKIQGAKKDYTVPAATKEETAKSAINPDDLKNKFTTKSEQEALKTAIKESQKELKRTIASIKDWLKSANKDIDNKIEALEIRNNQSPMNPKEYYNELYELRKQKEINTELAINQKEQAVRKALFEDENDRSSRLEEFQLEAEDAAKATAKFRDSLQEITGTIQTTISDFKKEGTTWRRETDNVNIEGLNEVALNAISALSQKFFELTGKQMVVSSGLRDWGGHVSGNKIDVVDDYSSRLLEDNVNGIRDAMIAYAESIGLKIIDEYTNPTANATAGHLDFDTTNFIGLNEYMSWRASDMLTKGGEEYRKAMQALFDEGNKLLLQATSIVGDTSKLERIEIENKYEQLTKKFSKANMGYVVEAIEKIRTNELLAVDFAQTQKEIEYANADLLYYQEELIKAVATGSTDAKTIIQLYIDKFNELTRSKLEELKRELASATDKGSRIKIRDAIKSLENSLSTGLENLIKAYEEELQMQLAEINANRSLTRMQKQDAIDSAERRKYGDEAKALKSHVAELRQNNTDGKKNNDIANLERQIALKEQLAEIPSLLDRIGEASKQAFEDGLLDFLERGIFECESLGDALRELAITVLQSIQKIFAEDLTKNIMVSLGMGPKIEEKDGQLNGGNILGQFGVITGNTNNFLASFNMQMNQFNMITQRAFQNIINTINKAKSSISSGGSGMGFGVGGLSVGSNFSYNSPYFGNMGGFDSMGSFGSSDDWRISLYSGLFNGLLSLLFGGGFAEGGSINKVNSDGLISGEGTGTSDSIFMWVDNLRKMISVSDAEWIMKEKAVNYYGPNIMAAINNGLIPKEVFTAHKKFSQGGSIRGALSPTGANGAYGLTTEFANNFSPSTKVNVNISERSLMGALNQAIEAKTETFMKKEMQKNAKLNSMLLKRVW